MAERSPDTMDLDLSDEQRELETSVHDLLDREQSVELARRVVEEQQEPRKEVDELWARMVALDWPALTVPQANGGLGLGAVELAVVCEQFGHALAPGPFLATASQFVTAVREAGSPEQRTGSFGPIAAGGEAGTFAFAEGARQLRPAGGPYHIRAQRRRLSSSTESKAFVLEPSRAGQIVVVARTRSGRPGPDGIGLFVVPADAAGLEIRPMASLDVTRELAAVDLSSVDPSEPTTVRSGEPGSGRVCCRGSSKRRQRLSQPRWSARVRGSWTYSSRT